MGLDAFFSSRELYGKWKVTLHDNSWQFDKYLLQ